MQWLTMFGFQASKEKVKPKRQDESSTHLRTDTNSDRSQ